MLQQQIRTKWFWPEMLQLVSDSVFCKKYPAIFWKYENFPKIWPPRRGQRPTGQIWLPEPSEDPNIWYGCIWPRHTVCFRVLRGHFLLLCLQRFRIKRAYFALVFKTWSKFYCLHCNQSLVLLLHRMSTFKSRDFLSSKCLQRFRIKRACLLSWVNLLNYLNLSQRRLSNMFTIQLGHKIHRQE